MTILLNSTRAIETMIYESNLVFFNYIFVPILVGLGLCCCLLLGNKFGILRLGEAKET